MASADTTTSTVSASSSRMSASTHSCRRPVRADQVDAGIPALQRLAELCVDPRLGSSEHHELLLSHAPTFARTDHGCIGHPG